MQGSDTSFFLPFLCPSKHAAACKGVTSIFVSSQTLVALANDGDAPSILTKTDSRGVPYVAVLAASSLGITAFLSLQKSMVHAFYWLVNLSSAAGLVSWCVLCLGHVRLMQGMRAQGYTRDGELHPGKSGLRASQEKETTSDGLGDQSVLLLTSCPLLPLLSDNRRKTSRYLDLPYRAPLQPYLAWFALIGCSLTLVFGGQFQASFMALC